LRMITSFSQLLVNGYSGQLDGEAALSIRFITEGTRRMRDLLADLLAYTQLSADARAVASEPVDQNQVLQKALENCDAAIKESGAIITSGNLPAIQGYEPHFVQVFQNLIGNAIKYRSGRSCRVEISAVREGDMWRFAVADNGIGIAGEYHDSIFGVFKRLHGKAIPGTGIGLAICHRVVERYGGRIWVESRPDEGATFYFTLPAMKGEQP
jgi:light-regulated signal transduction histidine kinase (bacteriophytochrome)